MGSWTIGKKLNACFAAILVLTLVLGCTAISAVNNAASNVDKIVNRTARTRYVAAKLAATATEMTSLEQSMVLRNLLRDPSQVPQYKEQFTAALKSANAQVTELGTFVEGADDQKELSEIHLGLEVTRKLHEQLVTFIGQNRFTQAGQFVHGQSLPRIAEMKKAADRLAERHAAVFVASIQASTTAESRTRAIAVALLCGALVLAVGVFYTVRKICASLGTIAVQMAETAGQVASGSGQVSASSQTLAQGASQQAASLEETSASSEQITSMTRKNSENSNMAAELMVKVDEQVQRGNRTISEMVQSMKEINTSSDKISKIIKVIDEISFQTNILALNAAVEAARAGEAGMGFAVVADEVRNLSQRCAQAAKDTALLIEESISRTTEGGRKLTEVTEVILAITENTINVKTLVDEVSHGSKEQSRGIEQISKAILQMEHVTQSAAASAEQGAAASEQMSAQAASLNQIADRLRLMTIGTEAPKPVKLQIKLKPKPAATKRPKLIAMKPKPVRQLVAAKDHFPMDDFREVG
jgi:methyl-accepting chemotaxis protein/methyl-accepting chemotaxis protein-1 (serine sensor receptor)